VCEKGVTTVRQYARQELTSDGSRSRQSATKRSGSGTTISAGSLLAFISCAVVCLAATKLGPAEAETRQILEEKNAAIKAADKVYSRVVESAEKDYEEIVRRAESQRAKQVADARTSATRKLTVLAERLTQEGQLAAAVNAYRAVYSIDPTHAEALRALKAARVDLKTIPIDAEAVRVEPERIQAERVVLWNTHNSSYNTNGTLECNVLLLLDGAEVWRKDGISLDWKADEDTSASIALPSVRFGQLRVEITRWQGYSGGLSEIQVWREGTNVALGRPSRASGSLDDRCSPARVTDGVTTSRVYKDGYWLLPDNQSGWVEVDFSPPRGNAVQRFRVVASKPWQALTHVSRGDVIRIQATGIWRAAPGLTAGPDGGQDTGGDEWGVYRDRFFLRGRIGKKTFRAGSDYTLQVPRSGMLEMGMQEESPQWHSNNSGFLTVTLTFLPRQQSK
jgi:hypothetical protein